MKNVCGVLFLLAIVSDVFGAPVCHLESKEKFFRLDLTIPTTFCQNQRNDPSCKVFPKQSLVQLHGLWPNYKDGYPEGECSELDCPVQSDSAGKYCAYPNMKSLYQSQTWKELKGYMAGTEKCLERHEWVKHGVCSQMDEVEYFKWSLEKTKEIADALNLKSQQKISQKQFDANVAEALPKLKGAFHVKCKGNQISGMYLLFAWGKMPGEAITTTNGKTDFGKCPQEFIIPE